MFKFIRFLVYSNVWVSLAVLSLTLMSILELWDFSDQYLLFVSSSTIAAYNYMRLIQMPKNLDARDSQKLWMNTRWLQAVFFTVIFSIVSLYAFILMFSIKWLWVSLPAIIVSVIYPLGFKNPFKSFSSLRNVPGLKLVLISLSWSYVTYLMPVFLFGNYENENLLEFFFRALFIAALTIPFDIRDKDFDEGSMKTLPQTMGVKRSKGVAIFFCTIYLLWKIVQYAVDLIQLEVFFSWLIALAYGIFLISRMSKNRSEIYCGFWIEAVPILAFASFLLFSIL